MADVFSKSKRSNVMSKIRSKDTKPEIKVRKSLHRLGYRFRLHQNNLPGKPDIVLKKYETAIQIRGCFWHCHSCSDGHVPKSRQGYWGPKLENNKIRDRHNDRLLRKLGWNVIVVWECKIEKNVEKEIGRICERLDR